MHHLNAAQTVVLTLKPLAPRLLNYAQLSLLKDSFKRLLWLLMEESTSNALQHTSQAAVRKAFHLLFSSIAFILQLALWENTRCFHLASKGRLSTENWSCAL